MAASASSQAPSLPSLLLLIISIKEKTEEGGGGRRGEGGQNDATALNTTAGFKNENTLVA